MTLEEFWQEVSSTYAAHGPWRYGQTVFNVLSNYRPDLADRVVGTELDPFYWAGLTQGFINFLSEEW